MRVGQAPASAIDPAAEFFKIVAGEWHLRFRKDGQEDLRIDEIGNYWICPSDGPEVRVFTLENVQFDSASYHVSFDKVDTGEQKHPKFPRGNRRQREVLDINSDASEMTGYAESDRHQLEYKRRKSLK